MSNAADSEIEEVPVREAWKRLSANKASQLIDVRTRAEWAFVGVPDLSEIGRQPILIEWQTFPENRVDPNFNERLSSALQAAGVSKDTELLFICRSGGRSLMAARVMAAAGYSRCRNVTHGFEGSLDPSRHRGGLGGWKADGLPWVQG